MFTKICRFAPRIPILLLAVIVVSGSWMNGTANASDTKTKIERVDVREGNGLVHIITTSPLRNSPTCATAKNRLTFSASRNGAKLFLATLLTAIAADKEVRLVGQNDCTERFNIETLNWLSIYR